MPAALVPNALTERTSFKLGQLLVWRGSDESGMAFTGPPEPMPSGPSSLTGSAVPLKKELFCVFLGYIHPPNRNKRVMVLLYRDKIVYSWESLEWEEKNWVVWDERSHEDV